MFADGYYARSSDVRENSKKMQNSTISEIEVARKVNLKEEVYYICKFSVYIDCSKAAVYVWLE